MFVGYTGVQAFQHYVPISFVHIHREVLNPPYFKCIQRPDLYSHGWTYYLFLPPTIVKVNDPCLNITISYAYHSDKDATIIALFLIRLEKSDKEEDGILIAVFGRGLKSGYPRKLPICCSR